MKYSVLLYIWLYCFYHVGCWCTVSAVYATDTSPQAMASKKCVGPVKVFGISPKATNNYFF